MGIIAYSLARCGKNYVKVGMVFLLVSALLIMTLSETLQPLLPSIQSFRILAA
jgi:hypothetical protein